MNEEKTTIFIDTQDMEERYTEELYKEYLEKENKQLQNNWNELKKWLEENRYFYNITGEDLEEDTTITEVLNKMQELENRKV